MKITVTQLKSIIESVLNEATCPGCGDKNAYIGLNNVECPNRRCSWYSPLGTNDIKQARFSYAGKIKNGDASDRGDPSKYDIVKEWGFTHVTWPDFVKNYHTDAETYAECVFNGDNYSYNADPAIRSIDDILSLDRLNDDEVFLDKDGEQYIYGNITGPGGSMWVTPDCEEVLFDDDGNIEAID